MANDERIERQAELESQFAYEWAVSVLTADLLCEGDGTVVWLIEGSHLEDPATPDPAADHAECIEYLTMRGLIERHPVDGGKFQILDESEATS